MWPSIPCQGLLALGENTEGPHATLLLDCIQHSTPPPPVEMLGWANDVEIPGGQQELGEVIYTPTDWTQDHHGNSIQYTQYIPILIPSAPPGGDKIYGIIVSLNWHFRSTLWAGARSVYQPKWFFTSQDLTDRAMPIAWPFTK